MSFKSLRVLAVCGLWLFCIAVNGASNSSQPTTSAFRLNGTTALNATQTTPDVARQTSSNISTVDPIKSCDREWASYYRSSILAYKPISERTFTKVVISTETLYSTTYTCSSTCGNVCYADVTTTDTEFSAITDTQFSTSTQWTRYNGTRPGCTIPSASCTSLWDLYSRSTSVWNTWYNNMGPPESEPPWPATPGCIYCRQTGCYIQADGKVQIFYWPATNATRDMCTDLPAQTPVDPWNFGKYPNTSYVESRTGGSVVLDGRTFYQGNVYLSVQAASVTDNCGATVGGIHSDIMLTLASTDIYSVRNDKAGVYPINYADFQPPYPWSAYKGALHDCASGMNFNTGPWCTRSVVFEDNFQPVIDLPISMMHIDPAWAGCKPIVALLDPPVALSSVIFLPTSSAPNSMPTAAQPVSGPENLATQTPGPKPGPGPDRNGEQPGLANPQSNPPPAGTTAYNRPPQITVGPAVIPVAPGGEGLVIQPGVTVSKGGPGVVLDGTTVHIGDKSITFESPAGTSSVPIVGAGQASPVLLGSHTLTFDSQGNLVDPGVTLAKDDPPVTLAGNQVVSVGASGITIIDSRSGEMQFIAFADLKSQTEITVGGQIFTIEANGNLILGPGTTLHVGDPAITISGTVVSVGTAGLVLVNANGSTKTLTKLQTVGVQANVATGDEKPTNTGSVQQQDSSVAIRPTTTAAKTGQASRALVGGLEKSLASLLLSIVAIRIMW